MKIIKKLNKIVEVQYQNHNSNNQLGT